MRTLALTLALLLLSAPVAFASVVAGGGDAKVTQGPDASASTALVASVRMMGALAENVTPEGGVLVRFQFVRPDGSAIAFLLLTLPDQSPLSSLFNPDSPGVDLLYYEQAPGDDEHQQFVSTSWEGVIATNEPFSSNHTDLSLALQLTIHDAGADEQAGTDDDQVRTILAEKVRLAVKGDLSGLSYTYVGDDVYVTSDTIIVYEDGCTGSPDYYDDSSYYDSTEYYDDTETYEEDWDGSSCDGDTSDDSDYSSDWDDSGDSSCSADDDYGDADTSSSACEGDTFDDDEEKVEAAAAMLMGPDQGGKPPRIGHHHRRRGAERMAPLAGIIAGYLLMKWATRRKVRALEGVQV